MNCSLGLISIAEKQQIGVFMEYINTHVHFMQLQQQIITIPLKSHPHQRELKI